LNVNTGITKVITGNGATSITTPNAIIVDGSLLGASTAGVLTLGGAGDMTVSVSATATSIDAALATGNITAVGGAAMTTLTGGAGNDSLSAAASTAAVTITGGAGADTLIGSSSGDTFAFGSEGSIAGKSLDVITNYVTGADIIKFGASASLLAADTSATAAGTNVQTNDVGLVTFNIADSTYEKKVTAIQTDSELDAAGSVAIFNSGSDAYIYYSGAATGNADDQIIKLANVVGTGLKLDASGYVVATNALGKPYNLDLDVLDDSGSDHTDDLTNLTSGLTISGMATPGATVTIYDTNGTTVLGTTVALSSGSFSTDIALSASVTPHSITATASKTGYTESSASSPLAVTVDTTAPAASTLAENTTTVLTAGGWNASETTSTIRATLSSTAGATKPVAGDSIELLLGGSAFSTAKTVQLSSTNITNGYVDFTVLKTDLGSDGAKVLSAKVTDIAGNVGSAGSLTSFVLDTIAPTVTITSSVAAVKVGETATITATFSEAPTGFIVTDLVSAAGAFSAFTTVDSTHYTATFTPTAGSAATSAGITIASGSYTDAAGNAGVAGTTPTLAMDMVAPAHNGTNASIVLADTALKAGETSLVTFTFSEAVTAFSNADVTLANGTMTNAASSDGGTVWTATFTPSATTEASTNVISVAMSGLTDIAGNAGTGTLSSSNYTVDTKAPTATSVDSDVVGTYASGNVLTFTFDAAVNAITGYTISGDPAHVAGSQAPTITFTPGATTATLTLGDGETVAVGDIITLTGVTDVAGNTAATLAFGALAAAAPG
jgi:hypothetical protein